jgi:glycosyltransferase involved in cell wall biosynthesis
VTTTLTELPPTASAGAAAAAAADIVSRATRRLAARPRRVLAITSNLQQASSRLRIAALVEPLRERGFELVVQACPRTWSTRRDLLCSAGAYHAVILQRKLLDPWNWRFLRQSARRVIFDVDDAVRHHPTRVGPYSLVRTTMRFAATTRNVDHVVAGNGYVGDMFRSRGCGVSLLPTAIDVERYRIKRHAPTDTPRLVWIGSRSTVRYLQRFLPAIEAAAERVSGLRLVTIADVSVRSRKIPVEHVVWSVETEADALTRGDIGIAPTPLDRWTLGKCGFKILQYMAAGLPVIASPVGANAGLVRPGETGLLPGHVKDWPDAIARLASDVVARQRMGHAGRAVVERDFRLDDAADAWAELLSQ